MCPFLELPVKSHLIAPAIGYSQVWWDLTMAGQQGMADGHARQQLHRLIVNGDPHSAQLANAPFYGWRNATALSQGCHHHVTQVKAWILIGKTAAFHGAGYL